MNDQNYHDLGFDVKNRLSIGTDISSLRNMLGQLALTQPTEQSIFKSKALNLDPLLIDSTTTTMTTTTTTTTSTTLNTPTRLTSELSEMNNDISNEQTSLNVTTINLKTENNEIQSFGKEQIKTFVEEPAPMNETIDSSNIIDSKNSEVTTTETITTKKLEESTTKPDSESSKNIDSNVSSTPSKKIKSLVNGLNQKIVKPDDTLIKTNVEFSKSKTKIDKEEPPSPSSSSIDKKQDSRSIDNVTTKEIKDSSSQNSSGIPSLKKRFSIPSNNNNNNDLLNMSNYDDNYDNPRNKYGRASESVIINNPNSLQKRFSTFGPSFDKFAENKEENVVKEIFISKKKKFFFNTIFSCY